ncbi:MAG: Phage gp6-like head-tail connector protein [uncultured Clostridium sp.]
MPDGLLEEVKDYLNITWVDERTENNITGMIKRGMAYLQKVAGVPSLDFKKEDTPKALLLDYVRYANSQALELFETNFRGELLSLHLEYQAKGVDLD